MGIEPIVEIHDQDELAIAHEIGAPIIGVNNRNLKTLQVDLSTSQKLSKYLLPERIYISESGIKTSEDVSLMKELGYKGILVGSSLMEKESQYEALRDLLCE